MNSHKTKSRLRNSRQGILKILALAFTVMLLLVACERPLQTGEDDGYPAPTDVTSPAEPVPTEEAPPAVEATTELGATPTVALEPEVTATEPAPEVTTEPATPENGEDESPRPEDEQATPEDEEPTPEATEEPTAEPTEEPTPEPEDETGASEERVHVVQAGENLYRIGLQYGVSWTVLAEYNNIVNPNSLEVGQQIRIPPTEGAAADPGATPAPAVTHIVQPGETLFIISQQYGVSWPDIATANNLAPPYTIHVGQSLVIPGGG